MERPVIFSAGKRYRKHSLELKRQIVEETLKPGASVARIARAHDINANQVFGWRKLYREEALGREKHESADLVAVTVMKGEGSAPTSLTIPVLETLSRGCLWIETTKGCLSIEGQPDAATLDRVLKRLL